MHRNQSTGLRAILRLVALILLAIAGCRANNETPAPMLAPIRASLPTATPRSLGGFDAGNAWLFGTSTPSATPIASATPGPSPTPTFIPTPINAETLKGRLLFLTSRSLPSAYAPPLSNLRALNPEWFKTFQASSTGTVWRFDPATYKVEPCDPPSATPTPVPNGKPTPSLLFGDLGSLLQRSGSACQQVYETARLNQTFSTDQRFEAYVGSDPNGGRPQIFVIDHQDTTKKMVTRFGSGVSYDPAFAPDGYHLVFVSQEVGQDNLYSITRDGTELKRLTRIPGQDWNTTWEWLKRPTWSADGTQIAFWSNKVSGARQIWVMHADGSNLHTISNDPRPAEDWDPVWVR